MAQLNNFDASQVEPSTEFEPIPAGKYVVAIVKSEMKPTKTNDGEYLELELEVLEGEFKGRRVWDRLTLRHPNAITVKIASASLSRICHSVGILKPQDSTDLHDLPLIARVRLRPRRDTGEMGNDIAGYEARVAETRLATPPPAVAPWRR